MMRDYSEEFRKKGKRVGDKFKGKKFELAPQIVIEQYDDIAPIFFKKILDLNDYLITDESSLYDFEYDHDMKETIARIQKEYGIDVSDLKDLMLVDIFHRIRILSS